jgi:hypothetical protein
MNISLCEDFGYEAANNEQKFDCLNYIFLILQLLQTPYNIYTYTYIVRSCLFIHFLFVPQKCYIL